MPIRVLSLLTCAALLSATAGAGQETGFLMRTIQVNDQSYRYSIFVPPDYDPEKKWPVVLFLHGSGERGRDGLLQTEIGIGRALRRNYRRIPAIVVMPQCEPDKFWAGDMLGMAIHCLDATDREFNVDRERLYVTGLSMGGSGAWYIAAMLSRNVAAVAPICGFVSDPRVPAEPERVAELAPLLVDIPIWTFHGARDQAVIPDQTRAMVSAIRDLGGQRIRYTELPEGDHNVWDQAYNDPEFWSWMFAQRAVVPPPGEMTPATQESPAAEDKQTNPPGEVPATPG